MYDNITVQSLMYGEVLIKATTALDLDEDGKKDVLYAEKKWGKIDDTQLWRFNWQTLDLVDADTSSGSAQVTWYEGRCQVSTEMLGQQYTYNAYKQLFGWDVILERVIGTFMRDGQLLPDLEHPADGAVVHWWLLDAAAPVHNLPQTEAEALAGDWSAEELIDTINDLQALYLPSHTEFLFGDAWPTPPGDDIHVTTTSASYDLDDDGVIEEDEMGWTGNILVANGEEAVKVVVVATYPNIGGPEWPVFAEITGWNFWTEQLEKVPQVRWAGEEIILEKYFGTIYKDQPVKFQLENQSPGALAEVEPGNNGFANLTPISGGGSREVWTTVGLDGVARCDLLSEAPGEVDVDCLLYDSTGKTIINKHGFVVFYLKLEEITLGNPLGDEVIGNVTSTITRVDNPLTLAVEGHNSGLWWDPENVWDASFDSTTDTLNVSQDALLRARVKGWFMGDNLSVRKEKAIDTDGDGEDDVMLPAGRWVLPDDWYKLGGGKLWAELRPHWDIMDQPNDNIMSWPDGEREWDSLFWEWDILDEADKAEELGPYHPWLTGYDGVSHIIGLTAMPPVIGPNSSLDNYTPYINPILGRKTILPNGELNWWDCPMPPAKIVFEIAGVTDIGYFKEVDKGDVYYKLVDLDGVGGMGAGPDTILYTNPFYATYIPASPLIPPFVNNGGYDWNSWDKSYGPYGFWDIFNQIPYGWGAVTPDDAQHPTKVEVYSDNHGEAMLWLNGDWNLDTVGDTPLTPDWWDWTHRAALGETVVVGSSTVVAIADYPYFRKHMPLVSDEVTKDWTWGKEKLIDVFQLPKIEGGLTFGRKLVDVWLTDRDGFPALGEEVVFELPGNGAKIVEIIGAGLGDSISVDGKMAVVHARLPSPEEAAKFELVHSRSCHHAVATVVVVGTVVQSSLVIDMYEREGVLYAEQPLYFTIESMVDPELTAGLNTGLYEGPVQSVVGATSSIATDLVAIWWQDGAGAWHAYQPGAPDWANDLSELAPGNVYWVNVKQNCLWVWELD